MGLNGIDGRNSDVRFGRILQIAVSQLRRLLLSFLYLLSKMSTQKELVVLVYHSLGPHRGRHTVSREMFMRQVRYLRDGYNLVSLDDVREYILGNTVLPKRSVAITFDDGYRSVYQYAFPYLAQMNVPAAVFLATGYVGSYMSLDESLREMLGWSELAEMSARNITIGAHTKSHLDLDRLDLESARAEIVESKQEIEGKMGLSARYLAYPRGRHSEDIVGLVRASGFECAFGTMSGFVRPGDNPFILNRVTVDGQLSFWMFKTSLTRAIEWYRRIEQWAKAFVTFFGVTAIFEKLYGDSL